MPNITLLLILKRKTILFPPLLTNTLLPTFDFNAVSSTIFNTTSSNVIFCDFIIFCLSLSVNPKSSSAYIYPIAISLSVVASILPLTKSAFMLNILPTLSLKALNDLITDIAICSLSFTI